MNLVQTLSQLRVLGQSLKKDPVCGEFTAQIKDIKGIKNTSPTSEKFPPEQNHAFTVASVTETGNRILYLLLTAQELSVEITEYQQSGEEASRITMVFN